jgi:hypothetical protein
LKDDNYSQLRALLAPYGALKSQHSDDWQGGIALPEVLAEFYAHIGPMGSTIGVGGNPITIPSLQALWGIQEGYRWHGHTGERLNDWLDDWLVIAQEGGNPFILEISSGKILFDLTGGKWTPKPVAPDLFSAIAAFAIIANVRSSLENGGMDDDCQSTDEYRARVVEHLSTHFGSKANALHFLNTWGADGEFT